MTLYGDPAEIFRGLTKIGEGSYGSVYRARVREGILSPNVEQAVTEDRSVSLSLACRPLIFLLLWLLREQVAIFLSL